jgi:hypothetical protein
MRWYMLMIQQLPGFMLQYSLLTSNELATLKHLRKINQFRLSFLVVVKSATKKLLL